MATAQCFWTTEDGECHLRCLQSSVSVRTFRLTDQTDTEANTPAFLIDKQPRDSMDISIEELFLILCWNVFRLWGH